jgi:hypothetical protein
MRTFTIAAVIVALLAAPAYSQGGKKGGRGKEQKTESRNPPDDKAYKAALDRIPCPRKSTIRGRI